MEPKNVVAIREWVEENRPDLLRHIDSIIEEDRRLSYIGNPSFLLLSIGFEAGRVFQEKNPNVPSGALAY